jgi:hypothetical protein
MLCACNRIAWTIFCHRALVKMPEVTSNPSQCKKPRTLGRISWLEGLVN